MHRAPPLNLRGNSIFSFQCASAAQHGRPLGEQRPFSAVRHLLTLQPRFFQFNRLCRYLTFPVQSKGFADVTAGPQSTSLQISELQRPHIFQGTRVVVRNDMWYLFGRHDEAATQGPIFVKLNHLAPKFSRGLLRSVSQRCHQRQRANILRQGSNMGPVRHLSAE